MVLNVAPSIRAPASKPIWQSKTFWLNVITISLAILSITEPAFIHVDAKTLMWITGILNILLRFLTHEPVSLTGNNGTTSK